MKIVVTGATGFIGQHFVAAVAPHHELSCIAREPSSTGGDSQVTTIVGDLLDANFPNSLPAEADAIVHLAQANAQFPDAASRLFAVNATSTQLLADYGRRSGVSQFVYVSSGNVYARSSEPLREVDAIKPNDFYGLTKHFSEEILRYYRTSFNTIILRLFCPYGPSQKNRMISNIIDRVRTGQAVILHNEGQPRTNPIYVADVVEVLVQALTLQGHHVVNVAGPRVVSVQEIALTVGETLGISPRFQRQPEPITWNLIADTERMRQLFSLQSVTDLSQGIRLAIGLES